MRAAERRQQDDDRNADIMPDTPLRLNIAAKLAFPAGGMTASGLMSEYRKGRLRLECIANKYFVTLNAIAEMRQLCALQNPHASTFAKDDPGRGNQPDGLSSTEEGKSAQARALETANKLRQHSRTISTKPGSPDSAKAA
jgi:hypothetical protein